MMLGVMLTFSTQKYDFEGQLIGIFDWVINLVYFKHFGTTVQFTYNSFFMLFSTAISFLFVHPFNTVCSSITRLLSPICLHVSSFLPHSISTWITCPCLWLLTEMLCKLHCHRPRQKKSLSKGTQSCLEKHRDELKKKGIFLISLSLSSALRINLVGKRRSHWPINFMWIASAIRYLPYNSTMVQWGGLTWPSDINLLLWLRSRLSAAVKARCETYVNHEDVRQGPINVPYKSRQPPTTTYAQSPLVSHADSTCLSHVCMCVCKCACVCMHVFWVHANTQNMP